MNSSLTNRWAWVRVRVWVWAWAWVWVWVWPPRATPSLSAFFLSWPPGSRLQRVRELADATRCGGGGGGGGGGRATLGNGVTLGGLDRLSDVAAVTSRLHFVRQIIEVRRGGDEVRGLVRGGGRDVSSCAAAT